MGFWDPAETHATEDLQKATEMQYKNLFFSCGGNATKAGVAIVAQRSKWWHCKAIQFNEPALKILQKNGRLAGMQLFTGDGRISIIALCFYGFAGTRWEARLQRENAKALQDIFTYAASLGSVPVFVGGDFNKELSGSEYLQEITSFGQWYNAAQNDRTPTCLKGKQGSCIDLFILNTAANSLKTEYEVTPEVKEKDHQYITITLKLPSPVQHEYRSKNNDSKVAFADPPENYQPPNIVIP